MKIKGTITIDGVQVGLLCKQNGQYFLMENTDFGWKRPFTYLSEVFKAVTDWWNN